MCFLLGFWVWELLRHSRPSIVEDTRLLLIPTPTSKNLCPPLQPLFTIFSHCLYDMLCIDVHVRSAFRSIVHTAHTHTHCKSRNNLQQRNVRNLFGFNLFKSHILKYDYVVCLIHWAKGYSCPHILFKCDTFCAAGQLVEYKKERKTSIWFTWRAESAGQVVHTKETTNKNLWMNSNGWMN